MQRSILPAFCIDAATSSRWTSAWPPRHRVPSSRLTNLVLAAGDLFAIDRERPSIRVADQVEATTGVGKDWLDQSTPRPRVPGDDHAESRGSVQHRRSTARIGRSRHGSAKVESAVDARRSSPRCRPSAGAQRSARAFPGWQRSWPRSRTVSQAIQSFSFLSALEAWAIVPGTSIPGASIGPRTTSRPVRDRNSAWFSPRPARNSSAFVS